MRSAAGSRLHFLRCPRSARRRPLDFPRVRPNVNAILPILSGVTDQEASGLRSPTTGMGGLLAAVAAWCLPDPDGHSVWFAATSGTNVGNEVTLGSRSASDFQAWSLSLSPTHTHTPEENHKAFRAIWMKMRRLRCGKKTSERQCQTDTCGCFTF